jgi:MFS family permease
MCIEGGQGSMNPEESIDPQAEAEITPTEDPQEVVDEGEEEETPTEDPQEVVDEEEEAEITQVEDSQEAIDLQEEVTQAEDLQNANSLQTKSGIKQADGSVAWYRSISSASWKALLGAFLGWVCDGYETYALVLVAAIAVPQLIAKQQLSQTPLLVSGALAVTLIGWATGGVISGILTDYLGRRRVMMISILWYALFAGLTAFSPNYLLFLAFRFLTGLGMGAEWGPGSAMVSEHWPDRARAVGAGVLQSGLGFGFLIATGLWFVVQTLGPSAWRYMFLVGILPAFILLYIRSQIPEPEIWEEANQRRKHVRAKHVRGEQIHAEEKALSSFTLSYILGTPELRRRTLLLVCLSLSTVIGWWAISTWIPQYATVLGAHHGLKPALFSTQTALTYNIGGIIGYLAMAPLSNVWGRKRSIWFYTLFSLITTPTLFLLVHTPALLLFVAAVNGFFTLGQWTWLAIYPAELFPTSVRGTAISLVFNAARYIAALGTLFAGFLIVRLGGIAVAATIISLIYILGLIVTPFIGPETKDKPLPA